MRETRHTAGHTAGGPRPAGGRGLGERGLPRRPLCTPARAGVSESYSLQTRKGPVESGPCSADAPAFGLSCVQLVYPRALFSDLGLQGREAGVASVSSAHRCHGRPGQ